jgi:hypothetical protein
MPKKDCDKNDLDKLIEKTEPYRVYLIIFFCSLLLFGNLILIIQAYP